MDPRRGVCYGYVATFPERRDTMSADPQRTRERVERSLARIRPALEADGGGVELVEVRDGVVVVRFTGACFGCPMSPMTLKAGVEECLRADVPEIVAVRAIP